MSGIFEPQLSRTPGYPTKSYLFFPRRTDIYVMCPKAHDKYMKIISSIKSSGTTRRTSKIWAWELSINESSVGVHEHDFFQVKVARREGKIVGVDRQLSSAPSFVHVKH